MICEKCKKNEATVYYRENVNGKEKSCALCADCAKKLEKSGELTLNMPSFFGQEDMGAFNSFFQTLFAPDGRTKPSVGEGKRCPLCGAVYAELAREGKVGCPQCYDTFSAELSKTVGKIHSNAVHTGKSPSRFKEKLDVKKRIQIMENELKEAVADERYERAAELRDELNRLRGI